MPGSAGPLAEHGGIAGARLQDPHIGQTAFSQKCRDRIGALLDRCRVEARETDAWNADEVFEVIQVSGFVIVIMFQYSVTSEVIGSLHRVLEIKRG